MRAIARRAALGLFGAAGLLLAIAGSPAVAAESITVASTTSTEQSGLFEHILPIFEKKTGIKVNVVAVGTGQAINLAERGDVDVLLVHHKPSEEKFVSEGYAARRHPVMYNDFVLVGPTSDPAGVKGMTDVSGALEKIASSRATFVSRGDDSGTHKAEISLWGDASVDPKGASGGWYRETGSGMGPTLNTASQLPAYTLTDRATWLSFNNKGDLGVLVDGDRKLFNQYGVMAVSQQKHPHVKAKAGQAFIDWLVSPEGQQAIAGYRIGGEQLFFPNAAEPEA